MVQNSLGYTSSVLVNDYWVSKNVDFVIGVGFSLAVIYLTQQLPNFDVTLPLMQWTGDMMKTLLISYSQMNFKSQLLIAAATGTVVYFGPTKVIEKTGEAIEKGKEIVDYVTQNMGGIGLFAIAGGVIFIATNYQSLNKKRKLL